MKAQRKPVPQDYVRYSDGVEQIAPDEAETIQKIIATMQGVAERTHKQLGRHVRVSHAKSFALAVGELTVAEGLPPHLRQGLFAQPAAFPVIIRLANVPGTIESDAVHTQRGFAVKILGARGEKVAGHEGNQTQDFIFGDGTRFQAANMQAFLQLNRGIAQATHIPVPVKEAVSDMAEGANKALHALGMDSANLDLLGHPRIHPLAEAYYTQAPMRFGDYIAKLAMVAATPAQRRLAEGPKVAKEENALSQVTAEYLRTNEAVFELRAQLCTDLDAMPVEDAGREWSEEESPYQTVARLVIPAQEALSEARRRYVDGLSFSPAHSLAAHRPLGSIMRARMAVYPEMSERRRLAAGLSLAEPVSIADVPE